MTCRTWRTSRRYNQRSRLDQRTLAVLLSIALVARMAVILVTLTRKAFNGNPTATVTGFSVVSGREVAVRFDYADQP